ncbi:MAG: hypothetical protein L6R43_17650, partial [Planctomycetes bacterium]|nr:hypothetical protein [Planctomycetota bacterium]
MRKAAVAAALALAGCAVRGTGEAPSPAEPPLPAASSRPLPEEPAALRSLFGPEYDEALAAIGLSRETARITASDFSLVAQGRFPTALFAGLVEDPTLADRWSRTLRDVAFASAGTTENASLYAAARLGVSVRPGLLGDPLAEEVKTAALPGAMEEALAPLMPLGVPPTEAVPPAVQAAAALVLRAARLRAIPWLKRALPEAPRPGGGSRAVTAAESLGSLMEEDSADPLGSARHRFERTAAATDQGYLARAAAEVLMAADRAAGILREAAGGPAFEFRAETTLGTVLLRGGGDDADGEGDRGPFLLRIDTGGDDRYAAGAAASPEVPVSVLLDVSGSDTYESPPDADAFGAGHFGVGVLLDLAGDDRYALAGDRSLGLGAGVFGVGA